MNINALLQEFTQNKNGYYNIKNVDEIFHSKFKEVGGKYYNKTRLWSFSPISYQKLKDANKETNTSSSYLSSDSLHENDDNSTISSVSNRSDQYQSMSFKDNPADDENSISTMGILGEEESQDKSSLSSSMFVSDEDRQKESSAREVGLLLDLVGEEKKETEEEETEEEETEEEETEEETKKEKPDKEQVVIHLLDEEEEEDEDEEETKKEKPDKEQVVIHRTETLKENTKYKYRYYPDQGFFELVEGYLSIH